MTKELTQRHEGTAEDLPEGFYWYENTPWRIEERKCSVCCVTSMGVEFVGELTVFSKANISGKFWKIERPTQ